MVGFKIDLKDKEFPVYDPDMIKVGTAKWDGDRIQIIIDEGFAQYYLEHNISKELVVGVAPIGWQEDMRVKEATSPLDAVPISFSRPGRKAFSCDSGVHCIQCIGKDRCENYTIIN